MADAGQYDNLVAQQAILLANPNFVSDVKLLIDLGLSVDSTQEEIEEILRGGPTEQAQRARDLAAQGPIDNLVLNIASQILIDFGVPAGLLTDSSTLPTDDQLTNDYGLSSTEILDATEARDIVDAELVLRAFGLSGQSTESDIDDTLTDPQDIASAMAARSLVADTTDALRAAT